MNNYKVDYLSLLFKTDIQENIYNSDVSITKETPKGFNCTFANLKIKCQTAYTIIEGSPSNFMNNDINYTNIYKYFQRLSEVLNIDLQDIINSKIQRIDICTEVLYDIKKVLQIFSNAPYFTRLQYNKTLYYNSNVKDKYKGRKMVFYDKRSNVVRYEYRFFKNSTKYPKRARLLQDRQVFINLCEYVTSQYHTIKKNNTMNNQLIHSKKELDLYTYSRLYKNNPTELDNVLNRLQPDKKSRLKRYIFDYINQEEEVQDSFSEQIDKSLQNIKLLK